MVFGYYAILALAQFLGGSGILSPVAALWIPNFVFAAVAVILLRSARRRSV